MRQDKYTKYDMEAFGPLEELDTALKRVPATFLFKVGPSFQTNCSTAGAFAEITGGCDTLADSY